MKPVNSFERSSVSLLNIVRAGNSPGRISLPVKPSHAPYARFKHVSGFAYSGRTGSYSVSRLRNLDILIDRLQRLKGKEVQTPKEEALKESDVRRLDALIEEYAQKLSTAFQAAGQNPFIQFGDPSGAALNIQL